jgi:hypothetical protein
MIGAYPTRGQHMTNPRDATAQIESTFKMLERKFGLTMTLIDIGEQFFPNMSIKTMQNKASCGELPLRAGYVYDIRDVAQWWDIQRAQGKPGRRGRVGRSRQTDSPWTAAPSRPAGTPPF